MFQKDVEMYHQFSQKNHAKLSTNKKKSKYVKFQYIIMTLVLLIVLLSVSVAVMWIKVQAKFDQVYEELRVVSSIKEDVEYIEQLQHFLNKQMNEQKPAALSQVKPEETTETQKLSPEIPYLAFNIDEVTKAVESATDLQPEENTTYSNFTYFVTPQPGNWFDSKRMCEENGGNLISDSLKSKRGLKSEVLEAIKANNDKHLWVGINKNNYQKQWQLLDGTSGEDWVLSWHPGEPNDAMYNGENCAHVITTTSQMNDASCYETFISWNYDSRYEAYYYGLCEKALPLD